MSETNQEQNQALRQVKAFAAKTEYFGIPADIVYVIVGGSLLIGATVHSPLLIIAMILFFGVPAYQIHREDPHAIKVWSAAARRRQNRWCAGQATQRQLIILEKEES